MNLLADLRLLGSILGGERRAIEERLATGGDGWAAFGRFAAASEIEGFLYSRSKDGALAGLFPPDLLKRWRLAHIGQWARGERLVRDLARVIAALDRAGLDSILLKGPFLAERFFGGAGSRAFADLDILVRREDLDAAGRILEGLGFVRRSPFLVARRLALEFVHAVEYRDGGVALDLHFALGRHPAFRIDLGRVFAERADLNLGGVRCRVLPDYRALAFSLLSIFRDLSFGNLAIRALVDLHAILEGTAAKIDWERFLAERKRERTLRISLNVLALFLGVFDCAGRFPSPASAVERGRARIDPRTDWRLLAPSRFALRNRLWALGLYEAPAVLSALWWAAGMPFRLTAYRGGPGLRRALGRT